MTSMESYVSQYKQALGAQSARTDYCSIKDLDEGHSRAKKLILEECRNEALRAGFNPIQSEDQLDKKLQEEYDAEKKTLEEQDKKAQAVFARFKSGMQNLQEVQPDEMNGVQTLDTLRRLKIEKRSAFLRSLPVHVQDMQNVYNDAMTGTLVSGRHREMFLEFLRGELPQQVQHSFGQLQSDFMEWKNLELEQQIAATNHSHNQEKENLRQQVTEESRAEVGRLQDEVAALKGALQAQQRLPDAEQARGRDTKRRRPNNVPAPAEAHGQTAELPDTSQKKRNKPDATSAGAGPSSDRLKRAEDEDRLAHYHEFPVGRGAFKRMTIQEHKECLLKLLPSDGKDVVRNMEERPPGLRRKAMWTELLLEKYDALNATGA